MEFKNVKNGNLGILVGHSNYFNVPSPNFSNFRGGGGGGVKFYRLKFAILLSVLAIDFFFTVEMA